MVCCCFVFQAEDGIRDLVRSRGLGDVYKRQREALPVANRYRRSAGSAGRYSHRDRIRRGCLARLGDRATDAAVGAGRRSGSSRCLLYTSDAADERSSVDLGGRRILKKKTEEKKKKKTTYNNTP